MTASPSLLPLPATTAPVPKLHADRIAKRYGATMVLHEVSLRAEAGDVIALIGASGSGKSTFLRCLNLLERPCAGSIVLAGETLALVPDRQGELGPRDPEQLRRLRTRLAMVFQQFNLWPHMTAQQNVMEGPMRALGLDKAEAAARAEHYLAKMGLAHRRTAYPAHLSGGEQQRAAIARALAMEPEVILFDEPTSALDPELVAEALRIMRSLAEEGRTMIIVTHEMAFAREVSRHVMFLHQGRVEEEGPPDRIMREPQSPRLRAFLSGGSVAATAAAP
jgi:arginine/ornithine transport system ATP-binding protein